MPSMFDNTNDQDTGESIFDDLHLSDIDETPYNAFIGHNLGHRVLLMSVSFRKFHDMSAVANDRDKGHIAQRSLDESHAKKLAAYMLKGLVSAAKMFREAKGQPVPASFGQMLQALGDQPYFAVQPIVVNIRGIPVGGFGDGGLRREKATTATDSSGACWKIFLSERHILWVIDGQHRRAAAELVVRFIDEVRRTGRYPTQRSNIFPRRGESVTDEESVIWNEVYVAMRSYATLSLEVHLGLTIDQERQLFHDLNRLGKKVDANLAFQFDGSNPITQFIKNKLRDTLALLISDVEVKDWDNDPGHVVLKDLVAINAIAFLNKGNISGALPNVIDQRESAVFELWQKVVDIPNFGTNGAKLNTVAAQPVVLKALAKITFDLNFSNRRPENGTELFERFLTAIPEIDFSHQNPMWRYFNLSEKERNEAGVSGLSSYLPPEDLAVNRDIGSMQGEHMRFGAKHNDIYPILADMIRWATGLPSRHSSE